jgi:hypothetical protein
MIGETVFETVNNFCAEWKARLAAEQNPQDGAT